MSKLFLKLCGVVVRCSKAEEGAVLILTALLLPVFLGFASLAVDYSYVLAAQRALQMATDAAALAGAQQFTGSNTATAVRNAVATYSATSGNRNALSYMTTSIAPGYPQIKCLTSIGLSCGGSEGGNAVLVRQTATVSLFIAAAVGFRTIDISATALAAKGGSPQPLNVMIVLDTTASMNDKDRACSVGNSTKLDCAKAGVRTILSALDPSIDQVGLMVYPGVPSSQLGYEYCSPQGRVTPQAYSASPNYQIVGLASNPTTGSGSSSDFKSSSSSSSLNVSSNLVRAVGGDPATCSGLQSPGGQGTFYADAIDSAQAALTAKSRVGVQNVMIILSDGDATSSSVPAAKSRNECRQGISAAQRAKVAGTWVFSIAYGAARSGCSTDSPTISPCEAMRQLASDASKFYSDNSAGCVSSANSMTEIVSIFRNIALVITNARLLDLGTS